MDGGKARRGLIGLVFVTLVAVFAAGVGWLGYSSALDEIERRGASDLSLAVDRLEGELLRYRELAVLTADRPAAQQAVARGSATADFTQVLQSIADKTGSLDLLLVDAQGREIVTIDAPADGTNHSGRPYFERALDGALGLNHQFSSRLGRRVFVVAAPVFGTDGKVGGAVIVTIDVDEIEASWRGDSSTVFFTDASGLVFLSNRSELLYRARRPPQPAAGTGGDRPIEPFVGIRSGQVDGHDIWALDAGRYVPRRALHLSQEVPGVGMTGEVLIDVAPARMLASLQAAVALVLCLLFGSVLSWVFGRRRVLAEANRQLEARVLQRTAELETLNRDLTREVAERIAAEARLKQAQADLVQAGKLSALGQMSAGISHELNQPLMAIRSFAENAETFLERGQTQVVGQNLARISELARRMGRIIRNLRAFARQESEALTDVDLCAVVEAALEMASTKAAQMQTELVWTPPETPITVRGGEVRLQQVVLNLVTNAIDAMEGAATRRVSVSAAASGKRAVLSVRDTGPGIAEPERIFDPFYSTKQVGQSEGMGLGLSISYGLVQSFGGQIRGRNHEDGGAEFMVELELVERAIAA